MTTIELFLIKQAVNMLVGSGVFDKAYAIVQRYADKQISDAEKRAGALAELEINGIKLAESAANFAIEAAVQVLKKKSM